MSGVNIRMIEQYEERSTVHEQGGGAARSSPPHVLSSRIEELLEYNSI